MGRVFSPLCPPCSELSPPKLSSVCSKDLSVSQGRPASSKNSVFPHVYNFIQCVLSSGQWGFCVLFTNLLWEMFPEIHCSIRETRTKLPKSCLGSKRFWQTGVPHVALVDLSLYVPTCQESQLWGFIVHRALLSLSPGSRRRLSATRMFVVLSVRTHLGHFSQVAQIISINIILTGAGNPSRK